MPPLDVYEDVYDDLDVLRDHLTAEKDLQHAILDFQENAEKHN